MSTDCYKLDQSLRCNNLVCKVHLNGHRNKIIAFREEILSRRKQSNGREGVPHFPFGIVICKVRLSG